MVKMAFIVQQKHAVSFLACRSAIQRARETAMLFANDQLFSDERWRT